jgi:hypothetical protein
MKPIKVAVVMSPPAILIEVGFITFVPSVKWFDGT